MPQKKTSTHPAFIKIFKELEQAQNSAGFSCAEHVDFAVRFCNQHAKTPKNGPYGAHAKKGKQLLSKSIAALNKHAKTELLDAFHIAQMAFMQLTKTQKPFPENADKFYCDLGLAALKHSKKWLDENHKGRVENEEKHAELAHQRRSISAYLELALPIKRKHVLRPHQLQPPANILGL